MQCASFVNHRFQTLDGMRGVAAIFVLIGHAPEFFGIAQVPRFWLAVDLFFLMSGFVLGRTYAPRFAVGMGGREFMIARVIRLYPLYSLGTLIGIIGAAAVLLVGRGNLTPVSFAISSCAALVMLPSPSPGGDEFFPFNFPAWSLFVELVANAAFVLFWRRLSDRALLAWTIASGLLLLRFSYAGEVFGGGSWDTLHWGVLRIAFSFFLGVLFARRHPGTRWRSGFAWAAPFATAALLAMPLPAFGGLSDGLLVVAVFPALVWLAALVEPARPRLFEQLGLASYPIYALHVPLIALGWRGSLLLGRQPSAFAPWLGFLLLAGIVPLGLLLDRAFDGPVRRHLIRRFAARPRLDQRLTTLDTAL